MTSRRRFSHGKQCSSPLAARLILLSLQPSGGQLGRRFVANGWRLSAEDNNIMIFNRCVPCLPASLRVASLSSASHLQQSLVAAPQHSVVLLAPRVALPFRRDGGGVKRPASNGRLPSKKGQEATTGTRSKHKRHNQPRSKKSNTL